MLTLVIGNKCYSSWSLRPWLTLKHHGIPFEEVMVPLDQPDTKARILEHSPAGKVPALKDGDVRVWDSLAILEYLAERFPEARLWPEDRAARAHARAISAEMHSGFQALRRAMPMNLGKRYSAKVHPDDVTGDVKRVLEIWKTTRERFGSGGEFLFGGFSAADAMFAPVVTRFHTYSVVTQNDGATYEPTYEVVRDYMAAVMALPAFKAWREAALRETWVLAHDEVDEQPIENLRPAL
ncbi:glutathione S-transferase family protein [Lutibaculum baratangense]|uniref:Glutathione S-transferase n=1 Tax=Lutibaculum baratangense AMV1 TaxID=631454 RepID=V4QSG7_9HYPH|nr:glutathione S-transferase family protein [Lutibaculum baratangense]ESR22727.1 Glutathione S-transferase [Lutibaculum baratangense AMV1]